MGVTNYYSVDGEILGERTSSGAVVYDLDPQGNVVATLSGDTVQNTYAFKPYGALLAKGGATPDPRFLWHGGTGFEETGRAFSDLNDRRRDYSTAMGTWTSLLPPAPGARAYAYGSPNGPKGGRRFSITAESGTCKCSQCSGAGVRADWSWPDSFTEGWIVQKVTFTSNKKDCQTGNACGQNPCNPMTYWERWYIRGAGIYVEDNDTMAGPAQKWDQFFVPGCADHTSGTETIHAEAKLIPYGKMPANVSWTFRKHAGHNDCAGDLATASAFPNWENANNEYGTLKRDFTYEWHCCCPPNYGTEAPKAPVCTYPDCKSWTS